MKKSTRTLLIAEGAFVLLSLAFIVILSYCLVDDYINFYNGLWIYGFLYSPVFVTGLCAIHVIWTLCNKKTKNYILSWTIIVLSLIYIIYVLCSWLIFDRMAPGLFAVPVLIVALWLVDLFIIVFKRKKP